jgi:hypothetical protein
LATQDHRLGVGKHDADDASAGRGHHVDERRDDEGCAKR